MRTLRCGDAKPAVRPQFDRTALALDEKPDLVLCDVMMPEMDGYDVLNALRAQLAQLAPSVDKRPPEPISV